MAETKVKKAKVEKEVEKKSEPTKAKTSKAKQTQNAKPTKAAAKTKVEKPVKNAEKTTSKKETAKNVSKAPKNIKILGYNDLELNTYVFDEVKNSKAVVLIVHGMQEHILRYTDFAKFLNKNDFVVVMSDLRGHGHTAISKDKLGFGEKDIFTETLQDQLKILSYINENYNLPIYLFGHSYGSMLSQNLIQLTPLIEKCVLCGTTNGDSFIMKMGKLVTGMLAPFKKYDSKGGMVEAMCIKSYGKKFERGNWLTRDEAVFDAYLKDEFCGGSFPFSFYRSMIKNMNKSNKGIEKIGSKKIFLIAGDEDPVGESGKQVKKLYKIYLKHNIDAKIKLYKDARHELLNETCKKEVYEDIVNFYNN